LSSVSQGIDRYSDNPLQGHPLQFAISITLPSDVTQHQR
jgi:hypothetical protein